MQDARVVYKDRENLWSSYDGSPVEMETGARLALNPKCEYSRKRFVYQKSETPEIMYMRHAVKAGDTVLDIGANIGYWSTAMSAQVGANGRVLAFEPNPLTVRYLKQNLDINGCKNVTVYECGLSNCVEDGKLYLSETHSGDDRICDVPNTDRKSIGVSIRTLDSMRGDFDANRISFIKIDVQGLEVMVLEGAKNLLKGISPMILIEYSPLGAEAGIEQERLNSLIGSLGFTPYALPSVEQMSKGLFPLVNFIFSDNKEFSGNIILKKG